MTSTYVLVINVSIYYTSRSDIQNIDLQWLSKDVSPRAISHLRTPTFGPIIVYIRPF